MKYSFVLSLFLVAGCATIHFRSNGKVPVSFDGNPNHQKEVTITGRQNFLWWGNDPDFGVVFVDEELKKAGYSSLSKAIIYEQKDPADTLISFLTFGIYIPKAWTITGFTEGQPTTTSKID